MVPGILDKACVSTSIDGEIIGVIIDVWSLFAEDEFPAISPLAICVLDVGVRVLAEDRSTPTCSCCCATLSI